MILETIVAQKKKEIREQKILLPQGKIASMLSGGIMPGRSFKQAVAKKGLSLIAEVKKASPSKGLLRADFDPLALACCYEENGAAAISVLTDKQFFQGSLDNLQQVKKNIGLPVLRKDFLIDPYQLYEAKLYGADAVLLIAAILNKQELKAFMQISQELKLDALVEIHSAKELETALSCEAEIIGINNRDLQTFDTDLQVTIELMDEVPPNCLVVSESGISTSEHVRVLADAGVDAVLVGEALVTNRDIAEKVRELTGR